MIKYCLALRSHLALIPSPMVPLEIGVVAFNSLLKGTSIVLRIPNDGEGKCPLSIGERVGNLFDVSVHPIDIRVIEIQQICDLVDGWQWHVTLMDVL